MEKAVESHSAQDVENAMSELSIAPSQKGSLYVSNIAGDISEPALYEFFSKHGTLISVRICRDLHTQASLGYGYVNFQKPEDAHLVLKTLNYTPFREGDKPMRIMLAQRDSFAKKLESNIFVKNIHKEIDDKGLHQLFNVFGPILSCKIARDKDGNSLGYGFVQYEEEKSALKAIKQMNGRVIDGSTFYVAAFKPREEKFKEAEETFTNVYIQHLKPDLTDEEFKEYFEKFGKVSSSCLKSTQKYSTKYGFVSFETHEEALKCIDACNGKVIEDIGTDEEIFAGRALKMRELEKERQSKDDVIDAYESKNVFVKNLPEDMTNEKLKEVFISYGEIIEVSVKIDPVTKKAKDHGFVSFKEKESAEKAITGLNEKVYEGKRLYVTYHRTAEQRRKYLERTLHSTNLQAPWLGFNPQSQHPPMMPSMPVMNNAFHSNPWMVHPGVMMNNPIGYYPGPRQMMPRQPYPQRMGMSSQMRTRIQPGSQGVNISNSPQSHMLMPSSSSQNSAGLNIPSQFNNQSNMARMGTSNIHRSGVMSMMSQQKNISGNTGLPHLSSSALANMSPEEQKNALGERLYARISSIHPEYAAKITGMLLEMDTTEILNVLEDKSVLESKISEAISVLRAHNSE